MLVPDYGFDRVSTIQKERTADWYEREPPPQTKIGTHLEKVDFGQFCRLFSQTFDNSSFEISIFALFG